MSDILCCKSRRDGVRPGPCCPSDFLLLCVFAWLQGPLLVPSVKNRSPVDVFILVLISLRCPGLGPDFHNLKDFFRDVFETPARAPPPTGGILELGIQQLFYKQVVWHPGDVARPSCSLAHNHHFDEVALGSIERLMFVRLSGQFTFELL